jgi:hypothetical protein
MPVLSVSKWVRHEPNIPGNLDLPVAERFHLYVRAGVSSLDFEAYRAALRAQHDAKASSGPAVTLMVKLGDTTLDLDGVKVTTLEEYAKAIEDQQGFPLWRELVDFILAVNRWGPEQELFYGRPSGGSGSTPGQSTAPGAGQTAAR